MLKKLSIFILGAALSCSAFGQTVCETLLQTQIPDTITLCKSDTIKFETLQNYDYLWSDNSTLPYYIVNNDGMIWVEITALDQSCSRRDTIELVFHPLPLLTKPLDIDTSLCLEDTILLDASGQSNVSRYRWSAVLDPSLVSTDSAIQVVCDANKTASAVYTYAVRLFGICADRPNWQVSLEYTIYDTAYVFFTLPPEVDLGRDSIHCPGEEFELIALNDNFLNDYYHILWDDYSSGNGLPVDTTNKGLHYVTIWNRCGDTVRDSVTIDFWPQAWTDSKLITDTSTCERVPVMLDASVPYPLTTYLWHHDSSRNPIIIVDQANTYTVTLTDSAGCQRDFATNVSQDDCTPKIEMPNIFTPNGDGINDFFISIVSERVEEFRIRIYSRWGDTVFEYEGDPENMKWDGTKNNKNVAEGVYYWAVKYKDVFGKKYNHQGSVNILR